MTGQIQGLTMLTSRLSLFAPGEGIAGEELLQYQETILSQRSGLADCLKSCSYTLAEVASETGAKIEHAEALKDATQLLGTFGDIKGIDFAKASTTIKKMVATDNAFQAVGNFSEAAFAAALSRNKKP